MFSLLPLSFHAPLFILEDFFVTPVVQRDSTIINELYFMHYGVFSFFFLKSLALCFSIHMVHILALSISE